MRLGPLEDLHTGIFPDSQSGDYSDVKVVTPFGEIPWERVSRISDEEMKALMIDVASTLYTLLVDLDRKSAQAGMIAWAYDDIAKWDRPVIREGLRKSLQHPARSINPRLVKAIMKMIMDSETSRRSRGGAPAGR
jgi:hypothetical protein